MTWLNSRNRPPDNWGLWKLRGQLANPLGPPDPYWDDTLLILRGQGTQGGSIITDSSPNAWVNSTNSGVTTSTVVSNLPTFGARSLYFGPGPSGLYVGYNTPGAAFVALSQGVNAISPYSGTTEFTLEAWTYKTAVSPMGIMSARVNAPNGWAFTTSAWRANIGGVWSDTWLTAPEPALNTWEHSAITRNGTLYSYWRNGVLASSVTRAGTINGAPFTFLVGASESNTTPPFPGISQLFIGNLYVRYTRYRSRYNAPFTPPTNFPPYGP